MELMMDEIGDVTVVRISGKLDTLTSIDVQDKLTKIIDDGAKNILIDCEKLDFISSYGLRLLLLGTQQVKRVSGQLRVCSLNAMVREVFDVSGFTEIIPVSHSQAEALEQFGAPTADRDRGIKDG
jgi:anti-sigma B factor antagonist